MLQLAWRDWPLQSAHRRVWAHQAWCRPLWAEPCDVIAITSAPQLLKSRLNLLTSDVLFSSPSMSRYNNHFNTRFNAIPCYEVAFPRLVIVTNICGCCQVVGTVRLYKLPPTVGGCDTRGRHTTVSARHLALPRVSHVESWPRGTCLTSRSAQHHAITETLRQHIYIYIYIYIYI